MELKRRKLSKGEISTLKVVIKVLLKPDQS